MSPTPKEPPPKSGELEELSLDECQRLLATQQVGRFAVIVGHYPLVFPVNYAVDGDTIVFRTGPGTKLFAIERSNVSFEVDEIDIVDRTGWSVLVRGVAQEIAPDHGGAASSTASRQQATPWPGGDRDRIVRIVPDLITGRRIRASELRDPFDDRRYL
jgi:nitroimidazol reductase NimA-like FMN-containing flavoprotein (pyridoxamine 5'-phosphate oxidase superfamily)